MNTSSRVDVVLAEAQPAGGEHATTPTLQSVVDLGLTFIDGADIAPDPSRRIIVLAPTKKRGLIEAERLGIEPVAVVTPRTPDGARGVEADEVVVADGLTVEESESLTLAVAPSLATSPEVAS
ncbi:hypothetical protein [Microbacterium galbinum]|uniref:Uncharacterized protein n=1 Tax=Microbacterium galbinum TaxID=2851646 RepID=A0ABY4IN22_9MICO|nr:hypothetical protein [Microbacterium galbinum]UPL13025.1 hypothetical protein KV396_00310 [Microbacterium galbinum]